VFNLDIEKDRPRLQTLLETSSRYRALLVTPSAYTAILVSPALARLWMGEEFAHAGIWAQVYLLLFLRAHLGIAPMIAQGIGQLRLCNLLSTFSMAINLAVSILAVSKLGYGGPILGTVVAGFVMDDLTFYLVSKNCGLRWRKPYLLGFAIVGCNLPMALAFYFFFPEELLLTWPALFTATVILLGVSYGTAMLLFVGEEQIKDFKIALRSVGLDRIKPIYLLLKFLLRVHRSLRHYFHIERQPMLCS
jgi:O-antigen/teichoic acid export membrane protein